MASDLIVAAAAAPSGRPPRRRIRPLTILVALGVVLLLLVALGITRSSRGGWSTTWQDNFSGKSGSAPSAAGWRSVVGTSYPGGAANWGTGEVETYTASTANAGLDGNGHLRITPLRDAAGAWTSARVETRRADFEPPAHGVLRAEARIQIPNGGQGYWPAFWMLGAPMRQNPTSWPGTGEIDIMENVGSEPQAVHGTLHCGTAPGGPCNENTGLGASSESPAQPFSAGFHTYSVEWDRSQAVEQIRWYVDGTLFHTVRSTDVDAPTWKAATGHGFFLVLNVAVGGQWPGLPDASTRSGVPMTVDYVRVSTRG